MPCMQFLFPNPLVNVSSCSSAQGIFTSKESHPKALKPWRNISFAPCIVGREKMLSVGVFSVWVAMEHILRQECFYDPNFAQMQLVWRALSKELWEMFVGFFCLFCFGFFFLIASNAEKLPVACLCYWYKALLRFSKCTVFHFLYIEYFASLNCR